MREERLFGGNTHAEIVRVGETVRRPTGPWTPGVHALLAHLEAQSYPAAPRARGLDEQAREILTYIPGTVVWPDHFALVGSDAALARIATLIRDYHDAAASFSELSFEWSDRGADPSGVAEVLCHNDLAPWNLIHSEDGRWAFIDWDLAAPGRRSWDLSWALLSFTPLMPASSLDEEQTAHRLAVFRSAYGNDAFSDDVLTVASERCSHEAERIERLGARGEQPYARLLREGHDEIWRRAAGHVASNAARWQKTLVP